MEILLFILFVTGYGIFVYNNVLTSRQNEETPALYGSEKTFELEDESP